MKKLLIFAAAFLLAVPSALAQNYSVMDELRSDPDKVYGMERPYRFEGVENTPAPAGYKPFYISHYGRHGSRWCWSANTYKLIHKVLSRAHDEGALTDVGETFFSTYEEFYPVPLVNTGDLVELGRLQHERIAREMAETFPGVFRRGGSVDARSSTSARCIVSMAAFCTSLQKSCPKIDITLSSTHMGMCEVVPPSAPEAYRKKFKSPHAADYNLDSPEAYRAKVLDSDDLLGRIFKDPHFLSADEGKEFLAQLYSFLGNEINNGDPALFADVLTRDQIIQLWDVSNYGSFYYDLTGRYATIPLLQDIIGRADAAISGGDRVADLRFGHDYIVETFVTLLNLNGCGQIPASSDEVKYIYQNYNIPKASNLQFVLYRGGRKEVIFKLLWNGKEATIPALTPVSGPYYSWSDFKAFSDGIISAHPEIVKAQ